MTMADLTGLAEGRAWKVIGGILAAAAVAIGTMLGSALLAQMTSLHASIDDLGRQTAAAVARLSDLTDSHKDLRLDINRVLAQQHDDEAKLGDIRERQITSESAMKVYAADLERIEAETKQQTPLALPPARR